MLVRWRLECAGTFRRRPVDDVRRRPHARTANAAVTHTFPLRDNPVHRVVGNIRAGDDTVGEVNLSHPVAVMTVAKIGNNQPG